MLESIAASHLRRIRHECHAPAVAWAAFDGDDVVSGVEGDGATIHTAFRIASMTKSFTAALVLKLRDEGVLSLDVPVTAYAPELANVRGPAGSAAITLRHLLSMAGGMTTDDPWADRHLDADPGFMDGVYASGVEFAHLVGEAFEYSNLGFGMIGRVVETVTRRRVRDLVDESLLGPLGMTRTTWDEPVGDPSVAARPHVRVGDIVLADGRAPLGYGEISPMGGLWSTVGDLVTWMRWLDRANSTPDDDSGPLSAASRREMQTIHNYAGSLPIDGTTAPSGYGFGLLVRDEPVCGMIAGHSGGLPGYGSNMRWMKGAGVGVVALANVTYAPMSVFTMRVLRDAVNAGAVGRRSRPVDSLLESRITALVELMNDWTDAAAEAMFADNVALDEPLVSRASTIADIVRACGRLTVSRISPSGRTHGVATLVGESGSVDVTVHLSPVAGGLVQSYAFGPVSPR